MSNLNSAIAAHRAGEVEKAYQLYVQHLKQYPDDLQAHDLLGVLLFNCNRYHEAIKLFQVIHQRTPRDSKNLNNLLQSHWRLGEFADAENYLDALIEQTGINKQTLEMKIALLQQQERDLEALEYVQHHLKTHSKDFDAWIMAGRVATDAKCYEQAVTALHQALKLQPNSNVAKHNLGLTYRLSGQPQIALKHYKDVEKNGINSYQLMHNMGNAYSDLGELKVAIQYYEKALSKNLAYLESHKNLNSLYWEIGDRDRFLESYKQAMQAYPEDFSYIAAYAHSLIRVNRQETALTVIESCTSKFSQLIEWQSIYITCLVDLKKLEQALYAIKSVNIDTPVTPLNATTITELSEQAIELKQFSIAKAFTEKVINVLPTHQFALSLLGLCHRHFNDCKYRDLVNYDTYVKEFQLFDESKAEDKEFITRLLDRLKPLHTATNQPIDQTLRKGTQTRGNLFQIDDECIRTLKTKIVSAIEQYIDAMPDLKHIHFPQPKNNEFEFSGSWSVRLHEEGYHSNHIHPEGWLSSVFYIELPNEIENENNKNGWLKFGEPNLSQNHEFKPEMLVKPKVGKLVLFPSYYWHGTIPFSSAESRTTIAFDVALATHKENN